MADANSLNDKGALLSIQGDKEGARLHFVAALKVDPNNLFALGNLGVLANDQNDLPMGRVCFERLIRLDPHNGNHWSNLGNTCTRMGDYAEAEEYLNRAKLLIPESQAVWQNFMILFYQAKRYDEAIEAYERCHALGNTSENLKNDLAHVYLAKGDLPRAFELYEARWEKLIHLPPWDFHIPEWKGEILHGKKILVHGEQGFGDTIMCLRFVDDLIAEGAEVVIAVPKSLIRLCEWQDFTAIDIMTIENLDGFDFHTPMYGMMRWLKIEKENISGETYLRTLEDSPIQTYSDKFNIGICWASGSRGGELDWRRRVAPLKDWLELCQATDTKIWSLQKSNEEIDIGNLGFECFIEDQTSKLKDWADTAAFINELDLIITVDTAIAHLAGALGKRVIMLVQFVPCWRWWNLKQGSGLPWYNSMKIIEQENNGDWSGQIDKVISEVSWETFLQEKSIPQLLNMVEAAQ